MASVESYNKELVHCMALFLDVFNDIIITRNNGKRIKVKALHGKRSRIYKSLENPHKTPIQPPLIICQRNSITRDPTRVTDLNNWLLKYDRSNYEVQPPVPVNIGMEVTIVTKYLEDLDKIITNIIPFTNQSFFVKSPHPKFDNEVVKHEVIWDGTITEEDTSETSPEMAELYTATLEYTYKAWIWPGTEKIGEATSGIIKKINLQPNLCSLGVQKLLWENQVATVEELSGLSGFLLDDDTYYGDIYSLSHWYALPTGIPFSEFEDSIELGRIENIFYDSLPISSILAGDLPVITGYVRDLSLGLTEGDQFNLSGNEYYYVDNEGAIIIYADNPALTGLSATCTYIQSGI